jgi:hypothetical protein
VITFQLKASQLKESLKTPSPIKKRAEISSFDNYLHSEEEEAEYFVNLEDVLNGKKEEVERRES